MDIIGAIETGRQAARQREEDAYIKARRPIVNAYQDRASELANQTAQQTYEQRASEEARTVEDRQREARERTFTLGSNILGFIADQKSRNPSLKPSEALAMVPPQYLQQAQLDTPEAKQAFAERHDSQTPEQMLEESRWFGGADPVVDIVPVKNNETGQQEMLFVRKSGRKERDPSISKVNTSQSSNPYQQASAIPGLTFNAQTGEYLDTAGQPVKGAMLDRIIAAQSAKAQGAAEGKATGERNAEDIAPSDSATRKAAADFENQKTYDRLYQEAGNRALQLIGPLSTGYAANTIGIAGTPAYQLNAELDTMGAQLQTDAMKALKEASKTGATGFGSLTEKEGELLRSLQASLKAGQDAKALASKIRELQQVHAQRLKAQEQAFKETYGTTPEAGLSKGGRAPAAGIPNDIQAILNKYKGK